MAFKLLYIEDNTTNIRLIRRMIKAVNYHMLEALDGAKGIEMALRERPDLILMDMGLPDMSGVEVIQRLKQFASMKNVPIIALTANISEKIRQQCLDAGCACYLTKPVSPFTLLQTLRKFADYSLISANLNLCSTNDTVEARRDFYLPKETNFKQSFIANKQESVINKETPLEAQTPLAKVLIAEDNPDLRTIFSMSFNRRHFSVSTAMDGVEAIQKLQSEMPDVLVLDMNMPRLSGTDVLSYVRKNQGNKAVKIIVVTGNSMASQIPEVTLADLFLTKPVDIIDLVTFAQRLIAVPV